MPRERRVAHERRRSPRYPAVPISAWLGWWEGGAFRKVAAGPIDVSGSGVMLGVRGAPPKVGSVYVALSGGGPTRWARARVVGVSKPFWGPSKLRLEMSEPWSYDDFKAIAYGEGVNDLRPPEVDPIDPEGRDFFR